MDFVCVGLGMIVIKKSVFHPTQWAFAMQIFLFPLFCMNPAFLHKTLQTPAQVHLAKNAITVLAIQFDL